MPGLLIESACLGSSFRLLYRWPALDLNLKMDPMGVEREKQLAAEAAAQLVEDGMTIGLGSGSTVAFLLPALARRRLSLRCVASSVRTENLARGLGLTVEPFDQLARLDLV